jgi:serine/threonine protein kinase, bacterial
MNRLILSFAVLAASAIGLTGCGTPPATPPASTSTAPAVRQTVVPFTGLVNPQSVAVDNAGDVYVVDYEGGSHLAGSRLVKFAGGSTTVVPLNGLDGPGSIAVDNAGSLYAVDNPNRRVLKLAAGSATPTVLPFTDLNDPGAPRSTAQATSTSSTAIPS